MRDFSKGIERLLFVLVMLKMKDDRRPKTLARLSAKIPVGEPFA